MLVPPASLQAARLDSVRLIKQVEVESVAVPDTPMLQIGSKTMIGVNVAADE